MKGSVILLDEIDGRKAAARLVDGQLDDLLIEAGDDAPLPGAIYRGICERPMKGQGGMFLRLPDGGSAFLRGAKGLSPGQALLVQVTGWAEPGKAVPVTERVLFKSRFAIVTPGAPGLNLSRAIHDEDERARLSALAEAAMAGSELGLILRSAAEGAEDEVIAEDIATTRALAEAVLGDAGQGPELLVEGPDPHALAWRDWPVPELLDDAPGSFAEHGVDEMIATLRGPKLALPGGGFVFIEQTRALIAVDVNTGGDTTPAAGLKANIATARALPRALRLRGLGGQITIDVAPMPKRDRTPFEQSLRAALKADGIETVLAGWTPLGHYELQRKRERRPLSELLP